MQLKKHALRIDVVLVQFGDNFARASDSRSSLISFPFHETEKKSHIKLKTISIKNQLTETDFNC